MTAVADKLTALGLTLPAAPSAVANYVPAALVGDLVYVSGQLPLAGGALTLSGKLGDGVTVEQGYEAARQCALNGLAAAAGVLGGDLSRVKRVVRVGGFVASAAGFTDQPKVVNGASDLMVAVFGDAGRHSRAAVGVAELPLGAAVEVEFLFQVG